MALLAALGTTAALMGMALLFTYAVSKIGA
jgi:hypothetical protein